MNYLRTGMILLAAALALGGCSSTGETKGTDSTYGAGGRSGRAGGPEIGKYNAGAGGAYGQQGAGGQYGAGGAYGAEGAGGQYGSPEDATGPLSQRVIYFGYDSSDVQPQYTTIINSHAGYLSANPGRSVVLEGHSDERGSSEYNIALGEQRAKAVATLMKMQGVKDGQIQIVSFGEEKPADPGHDESAWQQNRRVEISYPSR